MHDLGRGDGGEDVDLNTGASSPGSGSRQCRLTAGVIVPEEVNPGSRTVMAYLLSPVQKVTHEAGRERWGVGAGSSIEQSPYAPVQG